MIHAALHDGAVDFAPMTWPADCGAEVVFLGRTRMETHPQYGPLRRLEYEAFEPMAVKLLEQMARDAADRFACKAVRVVHARGAVEPGKASVAIQTATPHRAEAFEACRYLIERIKHELPVWKHEVWEHGETWAPGTPGNSASEVEEA